MRFRGSPPKVCRVEAVSGETARSECVLRWSGELDISTADDLLDEGLAALAGDAADLVIDLSEVTFLDSTTLGVLVRLRKNATKADKTLTLTGVPPRVRQIMRLTDLTGAFAVRPASTRGGPK